MSRFRCSYFAVIAIGLLLILCVFEWCRRKIMEDKERAKIIAEGAEAGNRYLNVLESFCGVGKKLYDATATSQSSEF